MTAQPFRSHSITRGPQRAPHRSLLRATGQIRSADDWDKPFVAVCIGHVSQAAEGGPIGLIRDGDIVNIDLADRRLDVEVSDEELEKRRGSLRPHTPRYRRGWLSRYERLVTNASTGAVLA